MHPKKMQILDSGMHAMNEQLEWGPDERSSFCGVLLVLLQQLSFCRGYTFPQYLQSIRFGSGLPCVVCNWTQIPWKTFATGPSSAHILGVTLVLEPMESANYDEAVEQALRDAVFAKKQVLRAFTALLRV